MGKSIFEKMVHSIDRKSNSGNTVLKVDMAKAYNRVEWNFCIEVLKAFSFSIKFCKLITECKETTWFSVAMNGTFKDFLKDKRGI